MIELLFTGSPALLLPGGLAVGFALGRLSRRGSTVGASAEPPGEPAEGGEAAPQAAEILASGAVEGLLAVGADGRVSAIDRIGERLLERPAGEICGLELARLAPGWQREALGELIARARAGEPVRNARAQLLTGLGQVVELLLSATGCDDALVLSLREAGDLRRAEELPRLLMASAESSPDAVALLDASENHAVCWANAAAASLTGHTPEELVGGTLPTLGRADECDEGGPLLRALEQGEDVCVTFPDRRADGASFWNEISLTPVRVERRVTHVAVRMRDATERQQHLSALAEDEASLRHVVEAAPVGIAEIDAKGHVGVPNAAFAAMLGCTQEDLSGKSLAEYCVDGEFEPDSFESGELALRRAEGEICIVEAKLVRGPSGSADGSRLLFAVDVSSRKRAQQDLVGAMELAQVTLESISDAVLTTRADGTLDYLNPVAESMTGWSREEAEGLPLDRIFSLVHESSREPLADPVERCLRVGRAVQAADAACFVGRDGREYAVEASAAPIRTREQRLLGAVLVVRDVTENRSLSQQVRHQAEHDALTGLENRRAFERRLRHCIAEAREGGERRVLCYVDLDRFKPVNDACGHAAGDELLRQVAGALNECVRRGDVVARLGGDEFAVLLNHCGIENATPVGEKICQRIDRLRFSWQDRTFRIGASVGLVSLESGWSSAEEVLAAADHTCYAAKDRGRGCVRVYEPGADRRASTEPNWAELLDAAIETNRLILQRQRIHRLDGSDAPPPFYEMLLRLLDAEGGVVPPMVFLPAAARRGMLPRLDRWVIGTALATAQELVAAGETALHAVNVSAESFDDPELPGFLCEQLERTGLEPSRICLEFEETALLSKLARAGELLGELRELGVRLAVDRFGSGVSALASLRALPLDYLKLDAAIACDADPVAEATLEAYLRFGEQLGAELVAVRVEEPAQVERLRGLGLHWVQGFALSHVEPIPDRG